MIEGLVAEHGKAVVAGEGRQRVAACDRAGDRRRWRAGDRRPRCGARVGEDRRRPGDDPPGCRRPGCSGRRRPAWTTGRGCRGRKAGTAASPPQQAWPRVSRPMRHVCAAALLGTAIVHARLSWPMRHSAGTVSRLEGASAPRPGGGLRPHVALSGRQRCDRSMRSRACREQFGESPPLRGLRTRRRGGLREALEPRQERLNRGCADGGVVDGAVPPGTTACVYNAETINSAACPCSNEDLVEVVNGGAKLRIEGEDAIRLRDVELLDYCYESIRHREPRPRRVSATTWP